MAIHNDIGNWGESIACETLLKNGYAIVGTNVAVGKNEIDIIALKNDRIVFVEVKTRTTEFGDPTGAIDSNKIRRLCRAADAYVRTNRIPHEVQFDVIVIIGNPGQPPKITHFPDAFRAPLSRY